MSHVATAPRAKEQSYRIWDRHRWFNRRRLFWITIVVAAFVYSQSQFWKQPSGGDRANWDYMAQVIARGGVPYRDVVNIKSPLSAYIGAAAIVISRPFGLRDILAIRITFILMAALTAAFTFLVALEYFKSLRLAVLAATVMLTFDAFARLNGGGIQPKTPMVLFGLLTLLAIMKDRPLAAGAFGMLSALCWQPGLLFVGTAGLAFSRYLTNWRDFKAARMMFGAAIPLTLMLAYFWAAGALESFYLWNIHFNATVYAPHEMRSLENFFARLGRLIIGPYRNSRFYFYVGAVGLCIAMWLELKRGRKSRATLESAPRHAVIIAPIVYFGFCMVDIQAGADLIPLVPFVAIFAALALVFILERAIDLLARVRPGANPAIIENYGSVAIAAVIIYQSVSGAFFFERGFPTLADQQPAIAEMLSHLHPGDNMFVYGRTEVLVLSGRTNISKHFLLDRGKAEYLDQIEPGGFDGWLASVKAERPKIVVLDRLEGGEKVMQLEAWAASDYQFRIGRVFAYYIRKGK